MTDDKSSRVLSIKKLVLTCSFYDYEREYTIEMQTTEENRSQATTSTVQRAELTAHPVVGTFRIAGAPGCPEAGAEQTLVRDVVHRDGDPEHGSEGDELVSHMAVAEDTVVGSPVVHHGVDIPEDPLSGEFRDKPGGGPVRVGATIQSLMHAIRQAHRVPLGDLKDRPEATDQIDAGHRHRHLTAGNKLGGEATTPEILQIGRPPLCRLQTGVNLIRFDLPEGFHDRFAIEIGRASCRERVKSAGVEVSINNKKSEIELNGQQWKKYIV